MALPTLHYRAWAWVTLYMVVAGCFAGLAALYLQVPVGFRQPTFWAPRPEQAVEVAALYRAGLGIPALTIAPERFVVAHYALLGGAFTLSVPLLALSSRGIPRRALWAGGWMLAATAVIMPPVYTTNAFYYGVIGEMVARFGANPYLATPAQFPDGRLLPFNFWDIPSPYGPIWTMMSALVALLGAFDPFRVSIAFKLLGAGTVLGTAWLLGRSRPHAESSLPLALLLLDPVIWIQAVADPHLDALTMLLVAAAVFGLTGQRPRLAWACLVIAMWVKILVAPLLGLHVVARLRREAGGTRVRLASLAILAVEGAVLTALAWLPYWQGPATLASVVAEPNRGWSGPLSSTAVMLAAALGLGGPGQDLLLSRAIVLGACAWFGLWLCLLWWLWRRPDGPDVLDEVCAWGAVLLALPFAVPASHPWYLLVPLGLLPFAWDRAPRLVLLAHALGGAWAFVRYVPLWA